MNFKKSFLSKNPLHMHGMPTDPPVPETGKKQVTVNKIDDKSVKLEYKGSGDADQSNITNFAPDDEWKKYLATAEGKEFTKQEELEAKIKELGSFELRKMPAEKDTIDPIDIGSGDLEMAEDDSWVDEGKEETVEEPRTEMTYTTSIGSGGSSSKTKIGKAQRPTTYTTSGTSEGGLSECKPGDDPVSCKMDLDAATKQEQQASAKAKKVGEKENKKMLTQSAKEQRVDVKHKEGQEKKRSKATTSKKKDRKKKAKKAKKAREKEAKLLAKTKQEEKDTVTGSF